MSIADQYMLDRVKIARKVIRANRDNPKFPVSHTCMLLTIATYTYHHDGRISINQLGIDSGMAYNTARKAIRELEEMGFIEDTKEGFHLTGMVPEAPEKAETRGRTGVSVAGRTTQDTDRAIGSSDALSYLSLPIVLPATDTHKEIECNDGAAPYGGPPVRTDEEEAAARLAYEERMAAHRIRTEPARLAKIAAEKEADELRRSLLGVKDGDRPLAPHHPPKEPLPELVIYPDVGGFEEPDDGPSYRRDEE